MGYLKSKKINFFNLFLCYNYFGDNMKKIILASNNKHKIDEFKEVLNDYEILSLNDIGFFEDII